MALPPEQLTSRVEAFIDSIRQSFIAASEKECDEAMAEATVLSLKRIASEFGTAEYDFNYSVEHYVEHYCDLIKPYLTDILVAHLPKHASLASHNEETDIAFVAYYVLSLIYKKEDRQEELKSLIGAKYSFFTRLYPLAFEVRSRYFKRIREYEEALDSDEQAIEFLEAQNIINSALCISYAATVCRMYDQGYTVEAHQRYCAERYIQDALTYNPTYPKYHFLKGKLLFYSSRSDPDPARFSDICEKALECIKKARQLQMGQPGAHFEKALKEYSDLKALILQELNKRRDQTLPFRHISGREFYDGIEKILSASDSKDFLPPSPNLKPGQKYVFISYSHDDFKSVYCDLMSLYNKKIPFLYDGNLPKGTRWDQEVHNYIQSSDCVGVIFYVSKNTILSEAIERECRLVQDTLKGTKSYFSVNLEGSMLPSEIMMSSIIHHGIENCQRFNVNNERMMRFLSTFHDDITFVPKDPNNGPQGTSHISELTAAINNAFPELKYEQLPVTV